MDDRWRRETEPIALDGGIHMPYFWTVGRVGSRFLLELKDNNRIMGNRCPQCSVVWVPPRQRCPVCFIEIKEQDWLEVGPQGTLRHFTIVRYSHPDQPLPPPFAYGIIDLDGADRAMTHLLSGCDLDRLASGLRVMPVFVDKRQGSILDIAYFTPANLE